MTKTHVTYQEQNGRTAPPTCHPTREAAQEWAESVHLLSGPDAQRRRTWLYTACDCEPGRPTALEPAPPKTVDGEVLRSRPAPRSPLDPDARGVYPTALRPVPTERIGRGR